ncbi:MAG: hypothetical protein MSH08_01780 [Ezakiella sp.]|nr:hypothetical protein [Ezakiella sp.]
MPNRVYVSASDPSTTITGVVDGDIWFDASKNTLYVRVNGAWVADTTRVTVGTAPAAPVRGDIYWDSTAGCLKIYDGTAWQTVASYTVTVAADGNKAKIVFSAPGKDNQEVKFVPGNNVSIGADAAKKEITISAKDTKYRMSASGDAAHSNEIPHPSAKIIHQEVGTETKEEVIIKGTGIADVTYDANTINIQVGRYRIEAVEGTDGAILKLVQDRDEQAPAGGTAFQVPVLGANGVTVKKTAVGSNSQITIEGTTYTLSSTKNADGAIEIILTDNKGGTTKGTIKIGQGLAVDKAEDGTLTLKSTVKVPAYTTSVAAKTGGGATINLNKDNTAVGTVNIVAGENSTVSVDESKNIVVESKDTTYTLSGTVAGDVATITLTDNLNKTSTVKIGQGDNVTLTVEDGIIKIKAVDTVYTVGKVAENNGVTVKLTDNKAGSTSQDVAFVPGDNVSISLTDGKIVIGVVTQGTISGTDDENNKIANIGAIKKYVAGGIAASDAMVFRGTIGTADKNPTVTALPEGAGVGDTYKVVSDGTYGTLAARVGDIIIYAKDLGWVLVPSGDDGNVYHAEELTEGQVVLGAGTASVKTLPAGANNQILRMKDGKAAWTDETAESQLQVADQETVTDTGTTVLTGMTAEGHKITPKRKNVLGQKDISVVSNYGNINVSVTYTKNNVVTDLNADTDVLILNGGTASTVL